MQRAQPFSRAIALTGLLRGLAASLGGLDLQRAIAALPAYQSRGKGCGARHKQACKTPNWSSGKYARTFNGAREVARRLRQQQNARDKAWLRTTHKVGLFDEETR